MLVVKAKIAKKWQPVTAKSFALEVIQEAARACLPEFEKRKKKKRTRRAGKIAQEIRAELAQSRAEPSQRNHKIDKIER